MKKVMVTLMCRNNEKYIPYFFKCINLIEEKKEYNTYYLIYTNNNQDSTLELLEKNCLTNMKIINKTHPPEILNKQRIEKLAYLRQDFFEIIKKEIILYDYLLMLDTNIFFNFAIFNETINILEKNNFDAITTKTIEPYVPLYYDFFSLALNNKHNHRNLTTLECSLFCFFNLKNKDMIDVKSAFGGYFLVKTNMIDKNNSKYDYTKVTDQICEHKIFNDKLNIKFANGINPLYVRKDNNKKFIKSAYNRITAEKIDNKTSMLNIYIYLFFSIFLSIIIIILLLIIF